MAENQELAKRIVSKQPVQSATDLLNQFATVDRYRNQISKVKQFQRGRSILPPLHNTSGRFSSVTAPGQSP